MCSDTFRLGWIIGLAAILALWPSRTVCFAQPAIVPGGSGQETEPGQAGTRDVPPWNAVPGEPGPPQAFHDVCFVPFDASQTLVNADVLSRWFKSVPGHAGRLGDVLARDGRGGRLEGLWRLRVPWTEQSALVVRLGKHQRLQFHLFHGQQGITLIHDAAEQRWTAYATQRNKGDCHPLQLSLTANDGGRCTRIEGGRPVDWAFRYRAGEVIVSCGDIAVLRAPLPGPPQDVFLEGSTEVLGIRLIHSTGITGAQRPGLANRTLPRDLHWAAHLDPTAHWDTADDGSGILAADGAVRSGWVWAQLPGHGPRELILHFSEVTPGTGVFLAAPKTEEPENVIQFVRNRTDGRTCAVRSTTPNWYDRTWPPPAADDVPLVGKSVWLRLAFGAGSLRWWVSTNGRQWAEPEPAAGPLPPGSSQLALCHVRGAAGCRIHLAALCMRELPALGALASPALAGRVALIGQRLPLSGDVGTWLSSIDTLAPAGADRQDWRRTCALAALGRGCAADLGPQLVQWLCDSPAATRLPIGKQFQLLDDAALLVTSHHGAHVAQWLIDRYFRLGERLWQSGDGLPFTSVRTHLMNAPWDRLIGLSWERSGAIREELMALMYSNRWRDVRSLCGIIGFYNLEMSDPLPVWADQKAAVKLGVDPVLHDRYLRPTSWRQPLIEELDRGTYNVIAELQTLIKADSWDEAAALIADPRKTQTQGVAPAPGHPDYLVSTRAMIHNALVDHPQLVAELDRRHGALARLRTAQASRSGDTAAVQQLAEQFYGTRAAKDALVWLGDQALARGKWRSAAARYRQALASRHGEPDDDLTARRCLAAALDGKRILHTISGPVHFGETELSAAQFDALIDDLLAHRASRPPSLASPRESAALPPGNVSVGTRVRLGPPLDSVPARKLPSDLPANQDESRFRQTAARLIGKLLLVNDRSQVSAFASRSGQLSWRTSLPVGKSVPGLQWPQITMAPIGYGHYVVARRLFESSTQLICLARDTGAVIWMADGREEPFVSDPFELDQQLACLTMSARGAVESVLYLSYVDSEFGQIERRIPLLRLRDSWWQRRCCQVRVDGRRLYVVLGGICCSCDADGRMHWIQTSLAMPPSVDPTCVRQLHQPPRIEGDGILVAQPGVRCIDYLDAATGRSRWRATLMDLEAIVGVVKDHAIIRGRGRLSALDIATGKMRWQHRDERMQPAVGCSDRGGIMYARNAIRSSTEQVTSPEIVWLDPSSGQVRATSELPALHGKTPRLGPLFSAEPHIFAYFDAEPGSTDQASCEIVELIAGASE